VILISDRSLQLGPIAQALGNLGLPYDPPPGDALTDEEGIRAVFCFLRIVKDRATVHPDYVAHRALLGLLSGVGPGTVKAIADACVANNQNFHDLFYLAGAPHWLGARPSGAVGRLITLIQNLDTWTLQDTVGIRTASITQMLDDVFQGSAQAPRYVANWTALAASLPFDMTLEELLAFLSAGNDVDRRSILELIQQRLEANEQAPGPTPRRIRILTMHGAKGLSGRVVFIPSIEQGVMPSFKNVRAAGLLIEHRRLFYVSVTRAMAACIVSHAALHTGAAAQRLRQQPTVRLPRSQFLNEAGVPSVNRNGGLTGAEAAHIVTEVNNL